MKKVLFILILFCCGYSYAQNAELQIYSSEKKAFTLFVDGLQENDLPKWKLKVKNLADGPHHLRILFESGQVHTLQKKIHLVAGSSIIYEIVKYHNGTRTWYDLKVIESESFIPKDTIPKEDTSPKSKVDSTSVLALKASTVKMDSLFNATAPKPKIEVPDGVDSLAHSKDTLVVKDIDSVFQCKNPLLPTGFALLMTQLESEGYEDLRLEKAKIIAKENCLSAIQIMEVMQLFEFEVSKLEFAIYSYEKCFDPRNYQFVEDAFEYQSSIEKLHNKIYAVPGKKSAKK